MKLLVQGDSAKIKPLINMPENKNLNISQKEKKSSQGNNFRLKNPSRGIFSLVQFFRLFMNSHLSLPNSTKT